MSAIDALLRGEPPRTDEERRTLALVEELRAGAPRAPEALRARVVAAAPASHARRVGLPSRRLLLVAAAALVIAAAGAALVHGIVGSGSKATTQTLERAAAGGTALAPAPTTQRGAFQAVPGAVPDTAGKRLSANGVAVGGSRLRHEEASLRVRVADVDALSAATSRATRIATALGGYAQSVSYRTPQGGGGAAYLELRVPVENVRRAVAQLSQLGTLVSQRLSVTDLQAQLERQSAQIAELRRTIAALEQALRSPTLPEGQRVLLRIRLAESKRALSQRLHARKGTIAAGTTSRISLVLATGHAAQPVVHHRGRLDRMLRSAVGFLGLEATVALYALIVVSPFALLAAAAWAVARARRRREERRLLAA